MILLCLLMKFELALLVTSLWGGLHGFYAAWLRCNSLEWMVFIYFSMAYHFNDHSSSLRLALHHKNRTLHPIQLPFLG